MRLGSEGPGAPRYGPLGVEVLLTDPLAAAEPLPWAVASGVHPWMSAWWLVVDHPYFAVTDGEGRFTIRDVPVGPQTVFVWHEAAKPVQECRQVFRGEVKICGGGPTDREFAVDRDGLINIDPPGR